MNKKTQARKSGTKKRTRFIKKYRAFLKKTIFSFLFWL